MANETALEWQLGEPTESGWYIVTVLYSITSRKPITTVLLFNHELKKWTFINEKGEIAKLYGEVSAWMNKPKPYKG